MAQAYPNIDEIQAKKKEFLQRTAAPKKVKKNQAMSNFLTAIRAEIKQSIKNGASNKKIVDAILETYNVKISSVTFAKYCEENGITTNAKKRK